MTTLITFLWFFLPAAIANMAPVFASRLPGIKHWNSPIDHGKSWRGVRLLGDNKTWRGLLSGAILGALTAAAQYALYMPYVDSLWRAALLGAVLGFGALVGDSAKSFFKRQRRVPPGKAWIPFDQTDYIFGGLLFAAPLIAREFYTIELVIAVIIIYGGLHVLVSYIGYLIGLKKAPI